MLDQAEGLSFLEQAAVTAPRSSSWPCSSVSSHASARRASLGLHGRRCALPAERAAAELSSYVLAVPFLIAAAVANAAAYAVGQEVPAQDVALDPGADRLPPAAGRLLRGAARLAPEEVIFRFLLEVLDGRAGRPGSSSRASPSRSCTASPPRR